MRPLQLASSVCALWLSLAFFSQTANRTKRIFDLSTDFSFAQSSESVWQYGYSAGNSLKPDDFRRDGFLDNMTPICFWHPLTNDHRGPGYYPYIAYNRTRQPALEPTHGWAIRPGEVAMEASNNGQYSIVRFTVPYTGPYRVTARFEGVHFHLSSTDVHVLHNSIHLFDAEINGYGGDDNFHRIEGAHPAANYEGVVAVAKGDTVDFAVGYGQDKTNYNDTTGLYAHLIWQPRTP